MWSGLLNSKLIKGFVAWGTKIIQSLDTIHGKFLAIVKVLAIFMAFKKINPLDFIKDISNWMNTIKDSGGLLKFLQSLLGLAPAMKVVTAETVANTIATYTNDAAKQQAILKTIGLQTATGTLSLAQKEEAKTAIMAAVANGEMDAQFGANMLAALGYSASLGATVPDQ